MKRIDSILDANFQCVKEYLNTGESRALSNENKKALDLCIEVYGMLKKYPQRGVCIKRLMALKGLEYHTAAAYVDFTRDTWGNYINLRREFLETFFLDRLMSEISNPDSNEAVRSKNLATLQRYLDKMPDKSIDPKLMEANTINIQVNICGHSFTLPQTVLNTLPDETRQAILAATEGEIDSDGATKLLES